MSLTLTLTLLLWPKAVQWPKLYNFAGGFHNMQKFWNMRGSLFKDTHLWEYVKRWRGKDGKLCSDDKAGIVLDHVSDPTQAIEENREYLTVQNVTLSRAAAVYYDSEYGMSDDPDPPPFDKHYVHNHAVSRAKEQPLVFIILLEMRFTEAILMMLDSEKAGERGNFALFQIAQRISALLYCVTNASGYVRICTEERLKWESASAAERLIQEYFVFTKLTVNGKSVFGDRYFEHHQRDIRSFNGGDSNLTPHLRNFACV